MAELPRVAIGTLQPAADVTPITWALIEALERVGTRVQSFLSHAYFCPRDGATAITGSPPRHLDTWLMSAVQCRRLLQLGSRASDVSVVEGTFVADAGASSLNVLCDWLDLPRLAVIDASLLLACQLPARPTQLDGLLIDRCSSASEFYRLQTQFEALWRVPVLGWLAPLGEARKRIAAIPPGGQPDLALCRLLGDQFSATVDVERLMRLIQARSAWRSEPVATRAHQGGLRVAVAFDEAFGGYFPDTLDLLEQAGAAVADFSPLADERLPPQTDVVYIGCGHPERFAEQLAANDCLQLALKSHLSGGGRIYAECGGLAYLCQNLNLSDGQRLPMAGVLPIEAHFDPVCSPPQPVAIRLSEDTWLGSQGELLRGYLSPRWRVTPSGAVRGCATGTGRPCDVVRRQQAIGSRVYLDFAAQVSLFESFFTPHSTACAATTAGPTTLGPGSA